jgi:hypothetical protein
VCRNSDEDAGIRSSQTVGRNPAVLKGFPDDLQQKSVLRIDAHGFARRDAEKLGVK